MSELGSVRGFRFVPARDFKTESLIWLANLIVERQVKFTPPKYDAAYHEGMSVLERDASGDER